MIDSFVVVAPEEKLLRIEATQGVRRGAAVGLHGAEERRGFGLSDKPKTGYGHDTVADDLAGLLTATKAGEMSAQLTANREAFCDQFTKEFFSPNADGNVLVTEVQRQQAIELCLQADKVAALEAMQSFGISDVREDLTEVTVPTLVLHGDADGIVPFDGSGASTHAAIAGRELELVAGAPHGFNMSHASECTTALLRFQRGSERRLGAEAPGRSGVRGSTPESRSSRSAQVDPPSRRWVRAACCDPPPQRGRRASPRRA